MGTRERAMKLLGSGVEQEVTAAALGVSSGFISQLLSEPEFASQVAELRLISLESASERDGKYDSLEDKLLEKLENTVDFMTKPREIAGVLLGLNKAQRRGQRLEHAPHVKQPVVNLVFPAVIVQKFVMDGKNSVIAVQEAGGSVVAEQPQLRDLTTITPKHLLDRVKAKNVLIQTSEITHGQSIAERIAERVGS